ncbi:S-adenosyl-L-methionine-dependent methyltransferase [Multifurca ochricompacta]|uniref:S-adenosyl-L-methionine-dependent methyltransferase n=1 Tax=Multifurca ochricompacta TaxID=376703 RepID=A0AAD4MAD7_9AGAM|nr:S-adenosyl-L-methionine-dependent methyltransferase [Multifurca ochricompacta]
MPRFVNIPQLVTKLASQIGTVSARLELKWLMQAIHFAENSRGCRIQSLLATMLSRRVRGEPIQYILGTQPFGHLNILTRPPVLIPRPETEYWTLRLADSIITPSPQKPAHVLDLCTGSGCIPLLLCSTWTPGSTLAVGVDISLEALKLAQDNTLAHASVVSLAFPHSQTPKNVFVPLHADVRDTSGLLNALSLWRPFDVITANPPYIPRVQYAKLDRSVRDFEDPAALLGDPPGAPDRNGLTFYSDIARLVSQGHILAASGWLVLEVGDGQARAVENIIRSVARMNNIEIWADQWGKDRVVVARWHE